MQLTMNSTYQGMLQRLGQLAGSAPALATSPAALPVQVPVLPPDYVVFSPSAQAVMAAPAPVLVPYMPQAPVMPLAPYPLPAGSSPLGISWVEAPMVVAPQPPANSNPLGVSWLEMAVPAPQPAPQVIVPPPAAAPEAKTEPEPKPEAKRTELSKAEVALESLYAEAGAVDEASFHQRLALHAQRQSLLRSMQDLDRQLDEQLGRDVQAEALREALQAEDVESWRQALAEAEIAQQALLKERDDVNQDLGQLLKARDEIAQASDVIAREHAYQALLDEFRRQTRAWLVRALAEDMIQETLKEVERTRQPAVLSHASRWFGEVTEGRYQRLVQHAGDFQVIDTHESRLEVEKLSQGTAEQLYLCLRLGLIQEFARQSANLPLIMDDVFVNFDPERARRVAELLVAFSSEHQVLLFTCHPETARLLQEVQPDVRLVTMPRYGGHETAPLERRAIVSQG